METYFSVIRSTGCIGSCYMDLCDHQDRYMHSSAEQLVLRQRECKIIHYQKRGFRCYRYRCDRPVYYFGKYGWIPYDKNGCSYSYFFRLLYTGDFIQQNEAKSRSADDPQNMCLYVDDHNGASTFILINQENLCACSEALCMGIFS